MTERPILFSGPMVRAILDGRKTQTRRAIRPQPEWIRQWLNPAVRSMKWKGTVWNPATSAWGPYRFTDRLWVKETFTACAGKPFYRADGQMHADWKWRPSIFMPRKYSRIDLEIMDLRVERIREITEPDAKAEGCSDCPYLMPGEAVRFLGCENFALMRFRNLWDDLNAGRGYGWVENPAVWVVEFKVVPKC